MFLISGPELVIAAAKSGVIGAFPAPNARTIDELQGWLVRISGERAAGGRADDWAINMVVARQSAFRGAGQVKANSISRQSRSGRPLS